MSVKTLASWSEHADNVLVIHLATFDHTFMHASVSPLLELCEAFICAAISEADNYVTLGLPFLWWSSREPFIIEVCPNV
jgi:hypothetical protein